ncbi:MAG: hypothetical protein CM15mP117_02530 [Alphaproteobacteria bacterium]|nr:MAG: hypothetical protein CM15mP117_02530 [Alphaproteobacteria bacterium]
MCGIVGYIGNEACQEIILGSLQRLEYRGYDSSGIATLNMTGYNCVAPWQTSELKAKISEEPVSGKIGIGHIRWAHTEVLQSKTLTHIA